MALVCDIKSEPPKQEQLESNETPQNDDLEDGEIEDDDEEEEQPIPIIEPTPPIIPIITSVAPPAEIPKIDAKLEKFEQRDKPRDRRIRHEDKKKHMTEAEKSILHLRKRERMQREKWEKYRKEQNLDSPDDFASNIEKAIASVLKKDAKHGSDEEKSGADEEKRGRKRKTRDKDKIKVKQRRIDSPSAKSEDMDENEFLNVRGGSPDKNVERTPSEESYDSEYSSDKSKGEEKRERKRDRKKNRGRNRERDRKNRERSRERRAEQQLKDSQGVCVFFLQGKCAKNDCPYSHEAVPPMKLELCKFYLMDCCAKGDKCSYMHSEFPCKFYHTGLQCNQADDCKFAHGKPLSEGLRQILFKHIETAPREILGGFPRMNREEALNMINTTQQNLILKYGMDKKDANDPSKTGIPSLFDISVPVPPELNQPEEAKTPKSEKPSRNRPSRWQDPDPNEVVVIPAALPPPYKPFNYTQDQDMRVTSNGDIDMRTLPPAITNISQLPQMPPPIIIDNKSDNIDIEQYKREAGLKMDVDIRNTNILPFNNQDVDIRHQTIDPRLLATKDVDIRQIPPVFDNNDSSLNNKMADDDDEPILKIDADEEKTDNLPASLPKMQRELFLRIQAQQKINPPEPDQTESFENDINNINWYSDDDDDDDNRLTIKVDNEEIKDSRDEERVEESNRIMSPPQIKPLDVVEKLGDLSKIDISAEVTKLLTSITQTTRDGASRDPRQAAAGAGHAVEPRTDPRTAEPRRNRVDSEEKSDVKVSIYEQGSIDTKCLDDADADLRAARPDVDLRNLHLPFKGMLNYTPAKEIDASINSHSPIPWKVHLVEIPRPDYTGLKLNVQDAEKTGDPRLRKIFRLSVDEKDSPASPRASPKAIAVTRIDPRLKKIEHHQQPQLDPAILSYPQQLNILQNSAFFQSLTSNQKLLLNQELANRSDQNGTTHHDPVLNSLLTNLNLIPSATATAANLTAGAAAMGPALNILANISKLNPMVANGPVLMNQQVNPSMLAQNPAMLNQMAQSIVQPGLLGAAPGVPNLPPDFQINFDPRNGGLLGNAPPFANYQQDNSGGGFNNFNEEQQFFGGGGGNDFGHAQSGGGNNRNNEQRGFNRDRRRGRNFNRNNNNNNNNNGNRNFRNRNNRSNRSHTPP